MLTMASHPKGGALLYSLEAQKVGEVQLKVSVRDLVPERGQGPREH